VRAAAAVAGGGCCKLYELRAVSQWHQYSHRLSQTGSPGIAAAAAADAAALY